MILYIKNMMGIRSKMAVKSAFEKLGIHKNFIRSGGILVKEDISSKRRKQLKDALEIAGFELVDEQKSLLIEKIKGIVVELVHYSDSRCIKNIHGYIGKKLHHNYTWLDTLFLDIQNITIEKFFCAHKIERAKELLVYSRLNLTQIAYQLNYDSVAQLSGQFREITGFSPSHFKKIRNLRHVAY
jgi:YesN/AraC family two-component response regulator